MIEYQHSTLHFSKNKAFSLTRYSIKTGLHFHTAFEFMFLMGGGLEVFLNGKSVTAKKGDIVAVNSSALHSSKIVDAPLDYYILIVSDEFVKAHSLCDDKRGFLSLINSQKAREIFEEIIIENEKSDEFSNALITGKIIELFVLLNREFSEEKNESEVSKKKKLYVVKNALDYLKVNFKNKVSIDDISADLAFSKSYLSHAFKAVTGYSIISYLNLLKCQSARALILEGFTIKQACNECGFSDLSYFTRTFKKTMGYLPSEIKK